MSFCRHWRFARLFLLCHISLYSGCPSVVNGNGSGQRFKERIQESELDRNKARANRIGRLLALQEVKKVFRKTTFWFQFRV